MKQKTNNRLTITIVIVILVIGVFISSNILQNSNGKYQDIPSIGETEEYKEYTKTFKTFDSNLFSFKYPEHLSVISEPSDPDTIYLLPINPKKGDTTAIVISVRDNNEKMTPENWLLGSSSGFNHSDKYSKSKIDGQDAVYTDGGMWIVVNTPNNEKRISIADVVGKDGDRLYSEMGIVFESLTFKR